MSTQYERKIILVGKTGHGKSSLGNVLLGRRGFIEEHSYSAVTKECQLERKGEDISIVDTPGLFDTDKGTSLVKSALEIQRTVQLCPEPHAFLIVLNGSARLTREELLTIDVLRIIFGEQCLKKAVIVFTHIENGLGHKKLTDLIERCSEMSSLIEQCGGRFARIDNTDPKPEHREYIISLVDEVSKKGTVCFKNEYLNVQQKMLEEMLEESLTGLDSKPVHDQIKQLSEKIFKAVEEEMDRRLKEEEDKRWESKARGIGFILSFLLPHLNKKYGTAAAFILQVVCVQNPQVLLKVVKDLLGESAALALEDALQNPKSFPKFV